MFTRVLLLSSVIIAASFAQGAQPPQPTNTQAAPSAQTTQTKTQASQPAATQGVPPSQPTAPMLTAQAGPSMPPSVLPNPAAAGPGAPAIGASGNQMVQAASASSSTVTTYRCVGPVTDVSVSNSGGVNASWGGVSAGYVCALSSTAPNGITADTCKAIYAALLTSRMTGQPVAGYFTDALSCSSQPAWNWLLGLYFGPAPGY
jgi:hypothetical protein